MKPCLEVAFDELVVRFTLHHLMVDVVDHKGSLLSSIKVRGRPRFVRTKLYVKTYQISLDNGYDNYLLYIEDALPQHV